MGIRLQQFWNRALLLPGLFAVLFPSTVQAADNSKHALENVSLNDRLFVYDISGRLGVVGSHGQLEDIAGNSGNDLVPALLADVEGHAGIHLGRFLLTGHASYLHFDDELNRLETPPMPFFWSEIAHQNGFQFQYGNLPGERLPVSRGIHNNPALKTWSNAKFAASSSLAGFYGGQRNAVFNLSSDGHWYNTQHTSNELIALGYRSENLYARFMYDVGEMTDELNGISGDADYWRAELGGTLQGADGVWHYGLEYTSAGNYKSTTGRVFNATGQSALAASYESIGGSLVYAHDRFDIGVFGHFATGGDISGSRTRDEETVFLGATGSYRIDDQWELAGSVKHRRAEYTLDREYIFNEAQLGLAYLVSDHVSTGIGISYSRSEFAGVDVEFKALSFGAQFRF